MSTGPPPIRGRGAAENPPNRFVPLAYEPDLEGVDPDAPAPKTLFFKDDSRSIITYNDSPDVGFEASLNPYRGCEHGCVYCLAGETLILMADGNTKPLEAVRAGERIYGTVRQGWNRRYVTTRVLAHWALEKPAYRITLEDGTELIASGDHRFLTERGWKSVVGTEQGKDRRPHLTASNKLMGVGMFAAPPRKDQDYADPAILRKRSIEGQAVKRNAKLRVLSVEPLGVRPLFDITTGTGDFIANGVVSHNCYARPTHEYLGFSAGLDFETRILVKEDAPALLRRELGAPSWMPRVLALSGVTDPYQPIEKRLCLTRRCLEVLAEFRNPVAIITKNHLVTRDLDLLQELARHGACAVFLSITTLRTEIYRVMEPRTSHPEHRLAAIRELAAAGVSAGVLVAPVIPGLTDHEIPSIIEAAAAAGARHAGYVVLRLPYGVKDLFAGWLAEHFPERRDKVLNRIRALRGGRLNDPRFGRRMQGEGIFAEQIAALFRLATKKAGMEGRSPELCTSHFRNPSGTQLEFFE
jgi:DNA repair photolyase